MTKGIFSIRIETRVWELFQIKFPNQASPMIEKFLELQLEQDSELDINSISQKIKSLEEESKQKELEKQALQMKLQVYNKDKEEKEKLLNSEKAKENKEIFLKASVDIRSCCSELCSEFEKCESYPEVPTIPFILYSMIDAAFFEKYMDLSLKNNHFELRRHLKNLRNLLQVNGDDKA